jgi:hypothetical protein
MEGCFHPGKNCVSWNGDYLRNSVCVLAWCLHHRTLCILACCLYSRTLSFSFVFIGTGLCRLKWYLYSAPANVSWKGVYILDCVSKQLALAALANVSHDE